MEQNTSLRRSKRLIAMETPVNTSATQSKRVVVKNEAVYSSDESESDRELDRQELVERQVKVEEQESQESDSDRETEGQELEVEDQVSDDSSSDEAPAVRKKKTGYFKRSLQ
jgi:hypothetical protein